MEPTTFELSLQNPLLSTYLIAASIMVLKVVSMSWLTVFRMMKVGGGYASPEDLRKTMLNPSPHPSQLEVNDYVDRVRRIQRNDLENVPFFLAAGFFFVLTGPSLLLAQGLLYGYAATRILHFFAYITQQTHELRASLWTPGSFIIIFMSGWSIFFAAVAL
jgi:glutathione S-transferase